MTTTAEHIAAIREALEAGPTPGEWKADDVGHVYARKSPLERHMVADVVGTYADEVFIVSCNPVAMTAVLAELDRLKAIVNGCDWYWPEDDTSSDACADGPWQIAENVDLYQGEILAYSRGGVVETRYYAFLPPAPGADSDDNFEVDEESREVAEGKIIAELARRAALKGDTHGN